VVSGSASRKTAALAAALVFAGVVYFASSVRLTEHAAGATALTILAVAVLLFLVFTVDPAWLLSGGILSTMFAGHWDQLHLDSTVAPHRVLLAAAVLGVLLRAPPARDRPRFSLSGVHLALAAALGYAVVSAVVAGTIGERSAYFRLIDQFGALPFLMFLVGAVAFRTERQRNILLGSLVAAGAYLGVTAVFEKLKLNALVVPHYITDPSVGVHFGRARGPFAEAGAEGLGLWACAVAAAVASLRWRKPWHRAAAAGVCLLALAGMQLTVTRGVWLAGIVGIAVILTTTPELRRFVVPVGAATVVLVLTSFALIPGLAREAQDRQSDKSPLYERENTNAAGVRMIADRPFLGVGWNRANERLDPYFRLNPNIPLTGAQAGLHNVYLLYGASLGLVGLGLWVLAGGLAFGGALAGRAPPSIRPWQIGLKGLLVGWLIIAISSPTSYVFITVLLWTWAGVVYGATAERARAVPLAVSRNGSRNGHGGRVVSQPAFR
jgi:O-antigen ligase